MARAPLGALGRFCRARQPHKEYPQPFSFSFSSACNYQQHLVKSSISIFIHWIRLCSESTCLTTQLKPGTHSSIKHLVHPSVPSPLITIPLTFFSWSIMSRPSRDASPSQLLQNYLFLCSWPLSCSPPSLCLCLMLSPSTSGL